ncbi:MAG: hypothetical protein ACNS63_06915 [Candidatus Nitrospinota bacterium M3_3B_026]
MPGFFRKAIIPAAIAAAIILAMVFLPLALFKDRLPDGAAVTPKSKARQAGSAPSR